LMERKTAYFELIEIEVLRKLVWIEDTRRVEQV
jgi:hypothetical protein